MRINPIGNINFGMNIIDVHAHIGEHQTVIYTKDNLDVFVREALPNNDVVEKMIVSDIDSFHGNIAEFDGNKKALETLKSNKAYSLIAGCSPKNGNVSEIERLFSTFPDSFVGLKFHPNDQHLAPIHPKYQPYFEFASRNNLPCLFHTHVPHDQGKLIRLPDGTLDKTKLDPYSDPELIYQAARKYKDTPFIMAHLGSGWNESHEHAIDVLVESVRKGDANLYADISWVDIDAPHGAKPHIVDAIKKLKGIGDPSWDKGDQSFRLMFGTDAPIARFKENTARDQYAKFIDDIKNAIKNDADLAEDSEKIIEDLFYNNAKKLFFSPKPTPTPAASSAKAVQQAGGGKGKLIAGIVFGALALIGGGMYIAKNKKSSEKKL